MDRVTVTYSRVPHQLLPGGRCVYHRPCLADVWLGSPAGSRTPRQSNHRTEVGCHTAVRPVHTAAHWNRGRRTMGGAGTHCGTLEHNGRTVAEAGTHCGTLEQGETHSGRGRHTLRHTGTGGTTDAQWGRPVHTAAHWNRGRRTVVEADTLQYTGTDRTVGEAGTHCGTLEQGETHSGRGRYTLRHTLRHTGTGGDAQWERPVHTAAHSNRGRRTVGEAGTHCGTHCGTLEQGAQQTHSGTPHRRRWPK